MNEWEVKHRANWEPRVHKRHIPQHQCCQLYHQYYHALGTEHVICVAVSRPRVSLVSQWVKNSSAIKKAPWMGGVAIHSSILARRIPWSEEPGRLQSMGSQSQTQLKRLSMHAWSRLDFFFCLLRPSSYSIKKAILTGFKCRSAAYFFGGGASNCQLQLYLIVVGIW